MTETDRFTAVKEGAQRAAAVAAAHAVEVDREARFPKEALLALRQERLLGAAAPRESGGMGCSVEELARLCELLARGCASSAMIFAMHQIQVASLARHAGTSPWFRHYLAELCDKQLLIASVTSEVGVGGDLRSSRCAVEPEGASFRLAKDATTISYGEHADELLVTTRRAPDAAPGDQVLVLLRRDDYSLERTSTWDTLGMRGTCSPSFKLVGTGSPEQILAEPFADIAARTMVPCSHLLWAGCWLGIASDAVDRARAFVRGAARHNPGVVPPGALRLAEASGLLQSLRTQVMALAGEYDRLLAAGPAGEEILRTVGYALKMNNLKVSGSQQVAQIVAQTLGICGMAGYKNDSKFSVGRHLRDAQSAALMISNDRIYATNASLLLVHKDRED